MQYGQFWDDHSCGVSLSSPWGRDKGDRANFSRPHKDVPSVLLKEEFPPLTRVQVLLDPRPVETPPVFLVCDTWCWTQGRTKSRHIQAQMIPLHRWWQRER